MDLDHLFGVEGKVAVVTGGSRGIGLMISEALVTNGCKVFVTARTEKECKRAAEYLASVARKGGSAIAIAADVSKADDVAALAKAVGAAEPRLHILVNNAGTNWAESISTYPTKAFDKVLAVNVRAPFALTQALLPLLEAAASPADPARVINIGSVNGMAVPALETYAYSTSKAAVHHLSRVMAGQLAARSITVNAIAPGPFPSKMMKETLDKFHDAIVAAVPLGRIGVPADMGGAILYLAGRGGAYVTGAVIPVDGGSLVQARM